MYRKTEKSRVSFYVDDDMNPDKMFFFIFDEYCVWWLSREERRMGGQASIDSHQFQTNHNCAREAPSRMREALKKLF